MRTLLAFAVIAALGFAVPAYADTAADQGAVEKDDAAIAKAQSAIEKDRAQKAQDKANGNWAGQAIDSIALGADHVVHTEKGGEKSADTVILNHDNPGTTTNNSSTTTNK